jgi:hypothetical protein
MKVDNINYRNNLQSFIDNIKNTFIERICLDIDTNPTFDKNTIPFEFKYCNLIRISTNKEHFDIITSMTESSVDTFWISKSTEVRNISEYIEINSTIKNIEYKNGLDNYAFKIKIEFENSKLFIYSGEVYDKMNNTLDYVINDEMILVFENEKEAEKYETIINESKIV